MRIFGPVNLTFKTCTEDIELENFDGRKLMVEKGVAISIPVNCFHYDEEFFPNPQKFDPERFNSENGGEKKYRDMGVFLPFGEGPRTCLGQKFALAQIKICMFELIRNFEITVSDKTRKDNLYSPKTFFSFLDGGIHCKFTELKN